MPNVNPHIADSYTLADACTLLVSSGANALVVDRHHSKEVVTVAQLQNLLACNQANAKKTLAQIDFSQLADENSVKCAIPEQAKSALLEQLIAQSQDAIYIKSKSGHYLFANDSYCQMIGTDFNQIIGTTDSELLPTALARKLAIAEQGVIKSQTPSTDEISLATPTGLGTFIRHLGLLTGTDDNIYLYGVLRNVTELNDVKAAQNNSELEIETIFRALPDLFFRMDADGTILDYRANESEDLYLPPDRFLGKRMQDVIPPELGQLFWEKAQFVKQTQELVSYEYDMEINEQNLHFEARLRNLPNSDELILIIRNTTELHEKNQALRALELQLSMALDAAQQGVWDWKPLSNTFTANNRFYAMLGYTPTTEPQHINQWNHLIHTDDQALRKHLYKKALKGELESLEVEFRAQAHNGDYRWICAKGKVVNRDSQGRALRVIGTHEDITERKTLQQQLDLAAMVFHNTSEGVIITDRAGRIVDVNEGFSRITGYNKEEALGQPASLLNSDQHSDDFYRHFWHTLNSKGHWQGEIIHRHKNGKLLQEWLTASAVYDHNHHIQNFVAIITDISVLKQSQAKLDHIAHHDSLTSLPNRLLLQARLSRALAHAKRNDERLAIMFLDIDRFKTINDSHGHNEGDKLLQQVARRLTQCVRDEDTVARLGGDEFVILLENLHNLDAPAQVAEKVLEELRQPFNIADKQFYTSASIGISIYPDDGQQATDLMRNADTAMYQVKQRGRDGYAFYAKHLTTAARRKAEMEAELHAAILEDQLLLLYQPQIDLDTEQLVGVEALVRWSHPVKNMIAPDLFIPLAEESNLIIKLGEWVLIQACKQIIGWQQAGLTPVPVAINVSGVELHQKHFADRFQEIISNYQIDPDLLKVEVTENHMLQNFDTAVAQLNKLREMGIKVAIDDFGTGYSSLAYLKQLPIHQLKIDRSFIKDIPNDTNDMAITRAIIAMGTTLGMEIIAEGIETREQQRFLKQHRCNLGQGYLFAKPLAADQLNQWL